jgi:hypothetical protein
MSNMLALTLDFTKEAVSQQLPGSKNAAAADGGFGIWLGNLMGGILFLASVLVLFYLLWGGIEWITSGGDKGKTEAARNKITSAIIGLIILASSAAVVMLIQRFLGVCFLKFTGGTC